LKQHWLKAKEAGIIDANVKIRLIGRRTVLNYAASCTPNNAPADSCWPEAGQWFGPTGNAQSLSAFEQFFATPVSMPLSINPLATGMQVDPL